MIEFEIIEAFVKRVIARAEANMEKTHKLEGMHYAAMVSLLEELRQEAPGEILTTIDCPECSKTQYFVCGDPDCICAKDIPVGELPQVHVGNDALACPYCGFTEHMDFWTEREMAAMLASEDE